jgi:hypothetical protein
VLEPGTGTEHVRFTGALVLLVAVGILLGVDLVGTARTARDSIRGPVQPPDPSAPPRAVTDAHSEQED